MLDQRRDRISICLELFSISFSSGIDVLFDLQSGVLSVHSLRLKAWIGFNPGSNGRIKTLVVFFRIDTPSALDPNISTVWSPFLFVSDQNDREPIPVQMVVSTPVSINAMQRPNPSPAQQRVSTPMSVMGFNLSQESHFCVPVQMVVSTPFSR
jgi:hypothetical protein